jgi:hypothetical protein
MEASSGRSRVRPIVVDFLGTLFITFCIGVATALVLGVCVVLMAGEARGAESNELSPMKAPEAQQGTDAVCEGADAVREGTPAEEMRAKVIELALTHQLVTKYTGLIAIDRAPARPAALAPAQRLSQAKQNAIP